MFFPSPQGFTSPPAAIRTFTHGEVVAGTTISHGNSMSPITKVIIQATGGAGVTVIATPNLQAGNFDGQIVVLEMTAGSTQSVTLSDETSVSGAKLRLIGATVLIGTARDSHALMWNAAEGMWYASLGSRVNAL